MNLSVGLPRMHEEAEERRDFLPDLVRAIDRLGASAIVLEPRYGSGVGHQIEEYLEISSSVRMASFAECLDQDVVLVLRCPDLEDLGRLRPGTLLISMMHYRTRPERVVALTERAVHALSLDAIADDSGRRLVENLEMVAWTGVREAFRQIERFHPNFDHPSRRPLHVTCLGAGAVGGHAVHAATRYGDRELREALVARKVPGVEATVVDFDLTSHEDYMLARLETTDLLIDATQRTDPSRPVIPNTWLAAMPADGVVLDLACDPYDLGSVPPIVKGIEGIPHGSLHKYVFAVDDPAWARLDPRIETVNRRLALSCYSWPGLEPIASMRTYGGQLEPILQVIFEKPVTEWDPEGDSSVERAVARAEVARWLLSPAR
jgi:alanine dehydrogenase